MFQGIEVWQIAAGLVGAVALGFVTFMGAMARFLKRPSPSEAIIRIGRTDNDVMPLTASATIFASVYFVSPCSRGSRSYATVAVVKPS